MPHEHDERRGSSELHDATDEEEALLYAEWKRGERKTRAASTRASRAPTPAGAPAVTRDAAPRRPVAEAVRAAEEDEGAPVDAHALGADLREELAGVAYWQREGDPCDVYVWTLSAWRNVRLRARDRRQLRYERYERERAAAAVHSELFTGRRARMRADLGPMRSPRPRPPS